MILHLTLLSLNISSTKKCQSKNMKTNTLIALSLLLATSCAQSKLGSSTNPNNSSSTTGTSDPVKTLGLSQIPSSNETPPALTCPTITDPTMIAQLAAIDAKFKSVYDAATTAEQEEIVSKIKGLLVILKDMTDQERKDYLQALPQPIPSCPVVEALVEGTYS